MQWRLPAAVFVAVLGAGCGGSSALSTQQDGAADAPPVATAVDARVAVDYPPFIFTMPDAAVVCSIRLAQQSPPNPYPVVVAPPAPPRGDPSKLTPTQLANRLTRYLWRMDADADLIAKIAACPPRYPDSVKDLARQMLADPRGRRGVEAFFTWWLQLDQLANRQFDDRTLPADLAASMASEPARFGAYVVLDGDSKLGTLLNAPFSFLNETLARHYGVPGVTGPAFVKVALDPGQRRGLLTQAGVLVRSTAADVTLPTRRGRLIREAIFCTELPDPPPTVDPGPQKPGQTSREYLAAETSLPECAPCHRMMDPVGLAFEQYDGLGRYRLLDQGKTIDPAGVIEDIGDGLSGSFKGPIELIDLFGKSQQSARCFVEQWFQFATGRRPVNGMERLYPIQIGDGLYFGSTDIRSVIVDITMTQAFLAPMP